MRNGSTKRFFGIAAIVAALGMGFAGPAIEGAGAQAPQAPARQVGPTPPACVDTDQNGNPDNDGDSLCDDWEVRGIDANSDGLVDLVLYDDNGDGFIQPEERPDINVPDLYVESDFMFFHRPANEAMAAVVAAFAAAPRPIRLHVILDEPIPDVERISFPGCAEADGVPSFAAMKAQFFGRAGERTNPALITAKLWVFRYGPWVHGLVGTNSSGCGNLPGPDFVQSLFSFAPAGTHGNGNLEVQAGTFMHELGHALGLRHGGSDDINCKPNYLSIMSYYHQLGSNVVGRPLDFSRQALPTLSEAALDERVGVGGTALGWPVHWFNPVANQLGTGPAAGPIDWNGNGVAESNVQADVNRGPGCNGFGDVLNGFDDWPNIVFSPRVTATGAGAGSTELTYVQARESSTDNDGDGTLNIDDPCPGVVETDPTTLLEDADSDGVGDDCDGVSDPDVDQPNQGVPPPVVTPAGFYTPVNPVRVLETRPPTRISYTGAKPTAGQTITLSLVGRFGIPANTAAVALNVTFTDGSGDGFVTVYPCDRPRPQASNLNYVANQTVPNLVITKLSASGTVCLFTQASGHLIADLQGVFATTSPYVPVNPVRVLETRPPNQVSHTGAKPVAGQTITLALAGRFGVAADTAAVALNVTITEASGEGFVTVYPCDQARPEASNLNHVASQTVPNLVITKLSASGTVCLFTQAGGHLIADLQGTVPAATAYNALAPARLLDTRTQTGYTGPRPTPGQVVTLQVTGRGGVPAGALAAAVNVTVTDAGGNGFVTVYPCDRSRPLASNLNFSAGQTVPNLVVTQLSASGTACLFTSNGTHLIADVQGYLAAAA